MAQDCDGVREATGPQATGFWELSVGLISGVLNIYCWGNADRQIGNLGGLGLWSFWNWRHFWDIGLALIYVFMSNR